MARKPSKGKQKIEIKRIENEAVRQVTFSKRRNGLFKKGTELVTLCGAEVLLLFFSPAGRPYTFGQPDVESVMNRFLLLDAPPALPVSERRHCEGIMSQLNHQLMELASRIKAAKANRSLLEERIKIASGIRNSSWDSGFMDLTLAELQLFWIDLAELKARANARVNEILSGGGASSSRVPLVANPMIMVNPFMIGMDDFQQINWGIMGLGPKFN